MQQNSNVIPQKRGFTPKKAVLVYFGGIAVFALLSLYAVFCDFDVFGIFRRLAVPYTGSIFFSPQLETEIGFYKEYFSRNHFVLRVLVGFVCLLFVVKDSKKQEDKLVVSDFKYQGIFTAVFVAMLVYTFVKCFYLQNYLNFFMQLLAIVFCDISVIAFGVHFFKRMRLTPRQRFLVTLVGMVIFYAIFIGGMYGMSFLIKSRVAGFVKNNSIHNLIKNSIASTGTSYNSVLMTNLLSRAVDGNLPVNFIFRSLFMVNFGFTWQYFVAFIIPFVVFIVPFYNWTKNVFVGGITSFFFGNVFLNFVISIFYWYGPTEWLGEQFPHPSDSASFFGSVPKNFNGVIKTPSWLKLNDVPVTIGITEVLFFLLFAACVAGGVVFTVLLLKRKNVQEEIHADDYAFNGFGGEMLSPSQIFKTKKVKIASILAIGFLGYLALTALFSKQGLEENSVLIMDVLEGRIFDSASLGNMSFDIQEFFTSVLKNSAVLTLIPLAGITVFLSCFCFKGNLAAKSCFKICAMTCCLCILFVGHIFLLFFMAIVALVFALFAIFAEKGKVDQKSVYMIGKLSCILLLVVDALFMGMFFYFGMNNLLHNAPPISLLFNGFIYPFTLMKLKGVGFTIMGAAMLILMLINHLAILYSLMVVDGTLRAGKITKLVFRLAAIGLFVMAGGLVLLAFMAFNLMDFFAFIVAGVVLAILATTILQLRPKNVA